MPSLTNKKGSVLLAVAIIGFTIITLIMITYRKHNDTTKSVDIRNKNINAFNIAEAGKEHAFGALQAGKVIAFPESTHIVFEDKKFRTGSYSVKSWANSNLDSVIINSIGKKGSESAEIEITSVRLYDTINVNVDIKASVTARSEVNVTGTITIDGRDWSADGSTLIGTGVKGITSCDTIQQIGASKIGGDGVAPAGGVADPIIEENKDSTSYPKTPEEVLGLTPGFLESYKTDTLPTLPFNGICYYNPPNDSFNCPNLKGSTGILIVHNPALTAKIMNFDGDFYGLIISDQISHINAGANIVGAVYTLSQTSGSNALGNGNANIKYSSDAITKFVSSPIIIAGKYESKSWRQIK